jgi:hypothetical protein
MQPPTAATLPFIPMDGDRPVSRGASTDRSVISLSLFKLWMVARELASDTKPLADWKFQIRLVEIEVVCSCNRPRQSLIE